VLGYILISPQGYAATAAVLAGPIATNQTHHTTDHRAVAVAVVNLDTEAQLVTSQPVSMLAAHLMHSSLPPSQLSSGVTVSVPPNSGVLDITCHAPTAAAAATCANAFAKAYVRIRNRSAAWQGHRIGDVIIKPASPA
jgi:capsular polysaccharide biosynthesis protein